MRGLGGDCRMYCGTDCSKGNDGRGEGEKILREMMGWVDDDDDDEQ